MRTDVESTSPESAEFGSFPTGEENSRRSFLQRAALLTAASVPAMALGSSRAAAQDDLVETSHGGPRIDRRPLPNLYRRWNNRNFQEIQADENAHVQFIVGALGSLARPKPTFQNLTARSQREFAAMSQAFENTGVGAYLGATPAIFDKGILASAAQIALVEAYHSGYLNTLLDSPIVPNGSPFAHALTIDQVVAAVSPFVVNLNGGPALTFSETPSIANDIAILNFALALEYLEAEFYNINVPRFFK